MGCTVMRSENRLNALFQLSQRYHHELFSPQTFGL